MMVEDFKQAIVVFLCTVLAVGRNCCKPRNAAASDQVRPRYKPGILSLRDTAVGRRKQHQFGTLWLISIQSFMELDHVGRGSSLIVYTCCVAVLHVQWGIIKDKPSLFPTVQRTNADATCLSNRTS